MKAFKKLIAGSAAALALTFTGVLSMTAAASANCVQYNPNGTPTSSTPVFNHLCGVPNGIGDEPDFVKVRPSNGDATSDAGNAAYTTDLKNQACNNGDQFDVHTYIHNDADPSFNTTTGSSIAHNVMVEMWAPQVGKTGNDFKFSSTVSASNASKVSDDGDFTCANDKQVKLSLVSGSAHVFAKSYGWKALGDNAVNGSTKVGSPTFGSGDELACWDYRIAVVYTVKVNVEKTPTPPTPPVTPPTPPTTPPTTPTPPTTTTTTNTPPTTLPNTGAGSVVGIFAATTAVGAVGYRYMLGRKLARQ